MKALRLAPALNAALLAALLLWIVVDPGIQRPPRVRQSDSADAVAVVWRTTPARFWTFAALSTIALATLAITIAGLAIGPPAARRLKNWFIVAALVAGWLALAIGWPDLAWAGQRWRIARQLDAFEAVAAALRRDWPREDGVSPMLGPFSAYPLGNPTSITPLTRRTTGGFGFTAIERAPDGALRFELAGAEQGAWLQWHPPGSTPGDFIGGLQTRYTLVRAAPLAPHWYATRYRADAP